MGIFGYKLGDNDRVADFIDLITKQNVGFEDVFEFLKFDESSVEMSLFAVGVVAYSVSDFNVESVFGSFDGVDSFVKCIRKSYVDLVPDAKECLKQYKEYRGGKTDGCISGILEILNTALDRQDRLFSDEDNYFMYCIDGMCMSESDRASILPIPCVDRNMINTGYDCCLHIETNDYARASFLAKEIESVPVYLLKYMCGLVEGGWRAIRECNKDRLQDFLCEAKGYIEALSGGVHVAISGVDEGVVSVNLSVAYGSENEYGFVKNYSSDDFWDGKVDEMFGLLPKIVGNILEEHKGIKIDTVWLYYLCGVDIVHSFNRAKEYPKRIFKGISREFKNIWFVPENPIPRTEDTYTVGLFICEDWCKRDVRKSIANAEYDD